MSFHPRNDPLAVTKRFVKDLKSDFKKLKHFYSQILSYDDTEYKLQKKAMGEMGMICVYIDPPGLQNYITWMDLENLSYAYYDYPDLFEELVALHEKTAVQKTEMAIDAGVESVLTGGSGSITLQSPDLFRKLSLPTIKKITKMCSEAGIISGIHSCGKEYYVVETCANETDLDYINPLEIPPMGDCELKTVKERFGHKLALMGNLHTTDVMLRGSVEDVRRESLKAIRDAGKDGGFVLSTGDQCGRDTPFENIFEMVDTCKKYGRYPLDMDRIDNEIKKLERV
jgi:uroporphyrinogen decarboxylase